MFTIATFAMMPLCSTLIFAFILPSSTPSFMVGLMLLVCLGVGCGLGYGVYHWPKVGVVVIGLFAGTLLGTLTYVIFFSELSVNEKMDQNT